MNTTESISRLGRARRPLSIALVLSSVAVGIALRFYPDSALWLDEALTVNISSLPLGDIADALRHDGHPPLYYLMLSVWIDIFGSGDSAVRGLSAVFGIAGIGAATYTARRFGGRAAAVTTLVVVATSPFAIRYSSEARMYSLVVLLVPFGWLALESVRTTRTKRSVAALAVVTAALLLTHYWAVFMVCALGLLLLIQAIRDSEADRRSGARRSIVALVIGGVLTAPWWPGFIYQLQHTGTPWASRARPTKVLSESLLSFAGPPGPEAILLVAVFTIALLLGALGHRHEGGALTLQLPQERWVREAVLLMIATLVIGGTATYLAGSAFQGRYSAVVFPIAAIVASVGIARLGGWTRVAMLSAVSALGLVAIIGGLKEDRTQAAAHVATILATAGADDVVVFCPDQLGPAGSRLLDDRLRSISYPDIDADPGFVDWVDYEDRNRASDPVAFADDLLASVSSDATIWVIWSGEYRTFEGKCNGLVDAIGATRQTGEVIASSDGAQFFESSSLYKYAPTP